MGSPRPQQKQQQKQSKGLFGTATFPRFFFSCFGCANVLYNKPFIEVIFFKENKIFNQLHQPISEPLTLNRQACRTPPATIYGSSTHPAGQDGCDGALAARSAAAAGGRGRRKPPALSTVHHPTPSETAALCCVVYFRCCYYSWASACLLHRLVVLRVCACLRDSRRDS